VLEASQGILIAGEASSGTDALALIERVKPAVAVLDVEMPGASGLDVARAVQERGLSTAIVILTMYTDDGMFNRAIDQGVLAYVLKENAVSEVIAGIKAAAAGEYYISPGISGFLINRSNRRKHATDAVPALASLTPAEWRILKLIAGNKTTKEIAADLSISLKTVENHRSNIADKLNLHGTNAILRFALQNRGLL
jgi:DNA-binding NarL/FixJ family response regulator